MAVRGIGKARRAKGARGARRRSRGGSAKKTRGSAPKINTKRVKGVSNNVGNRRAKTPKKKEKEEEEQTLEENLTEQAIDPLTLEELLSTATSKESESTEKLSQSLNETTDPELDMLRGLLSSY